LPVTQHNTPCHVCFVDHFSRLTSAAHIPIAALAENGFSLAISFALQVRAEVVREEVMARPTATDEALPSPLSFDFKQHGGATDWSDRR
jgi:hypothetical protein